MNQAKSHFAANSPLFRRWQRLLPVLAFVVTQIACWGSCLTMKKTYQMPALV